MSFSCFWLADLLRAAGVAVIEVPGWQTRGRGEMGTVRGVLCHHTAGPKTGIAPSLSTVIDGRHDLPGPLSHLLLDRGGGFRVIAAGRCNHAGAGSWQGITTGNSSFIGIEAENTGLTDDPWPDVQYDAYARGVAAILKHIGAPPIMAVGHKEYALPHGRKSDPSFDMDAFRQQVQAKMGAAGLDLPHAKPPPISRPTIGRGDAGEDVRTAQHALGIKADGDFGPATEAAVKSFQARQGLTADGVIGRETWEHLVP